jgi:hypothetical protein
MSFSMQRGPGCYPVKRTWRVGVVSYIWMQMLEI